MFHTGSWVWDIRRAAPVYWSAEMYRLHGRDPANGLPTAAELAALYQPDDWTDWLTAVENSRRHGAELGFGCRLVLPGGVVNHVRMTGHPISGAAGDVTEIIGSAIHISGQPDQQDTVQNPQQQVIDLIPALVWSSKADGTVNFYNRAWLDYTGLTTEEAMDWRWTGTFHPEDVDSVVGYWQTLLSSEEAGEIEARLRRHDGEYRWFLFRIKPIKDATGKIINWYGTNTDIEDRKRAEGALRESEIQLRLMVDSIPALVCTMTATGQVEYVNRQVLHYFGNTLEELKDWAHNGSTHEEDVPETVAKWKHAVETGTPYDTEHRLRRADGVFRWFHVRGLPLRNGEGRTIRWYVLLTDVDDRKCSEQAVRISERELRHLVETIPALNWRSTPEGELDYFNRRYLDYLDATSEQLSSGRWLELVHPEHRDTTVQRWLQAAASGSSYQDVYKIRRADGQYRWIRSQGEPLRDSEGRIIRWYGLVTDIDDHKRAEDNLRESERELRQIVDSVPGMIATANAKGEHDYASKRTLDYTGTTVEEARGLGFVNTIHPDDQEFVKHEWIRSVTLGQPMEINHRWRRFDGVYRWFRVRVHPRFDENGEVVRWYGLLTDIEDQRQAEEALRKSEQHLRLLVETLPAVVWRATAEGAIDYANQRLGEYLGKPKNYLTGDEWIADLHPEDVDATVEKWGHSCRAGESYNTSFRLRRSDGEYRWVQVIGEPLRDASGQILNWYGLMLDIDDRMRAEQGLRDREAHLRGVLETVPALVTRSTPEGRIEYVNQRVVDFLGENVEQIGSTAIHPDDRDSHVRRWLNSLETGEPCEETYRLRRVDGEYRWFLVRIEAVRDREGRVASWYTVHIDVDDSKKIAEELRHTQSRLSRASQIATVAELSASIAHEINQPLAAVVANGHACHAWLSNDPPNLVRARLTAERIIENGNSAAEVVRRIRALFKQAPPAMVLAAINQIVVEVLTLVADETRDHGIVVTADLEEGVPMILIDRVQIQQVLINLVHNAIEAMEGITNRYKELVLVSRRDGGDIRVEVRDRGRGLANPKSVFDPFFTTKENGMGMGLAICRSIIEAHGGRLWATPNEGDGTTFSFALPSPPERQV